MEGLNNKAMNSNYYQHFDIIVVIPVGPGSQVEFITDTIDSYIHYTTSSYKILLIDDSHQNIGKMIIDMFPHYDLIVTKKPMGGWAGLYITLSNAFNYALQNYSFKALLKLDTDALIIGHQPEKAALELFRKIPASGIAGQYPFEPNGKPWNIEWPRKRILNGTTTWKFFRRPFANWVLIKLHRQALKNGYKTGESVFGGAYFVSRPYLKTLLAEGLLPKNSFASLNIGEDHLFSLLAKAKGFTLNSLSGEGGPMCCAWKGLPFSPENLLDRNVKIIHSVRSWRDMDETQIRSIFRLKRSNYLTQ